MPEVKKLAVLTDIAEEACVVCGSGEIRWRNCKLICHNCRTILRSCADC